MALFVMTLPYSGAIFVQAFPRECTETFLEGLEGTNSKIRPRQRPAYGYRAHIIRKLYALHTTRLVLVG